jgi:hypothetical protein
MSNVLLVCASAFAEKEKEHAESLSYAELSFLLSD